MSKKDVKEGCQRRMSKKVAKESTENRVIFLNCLLPKLRFLNQASYPPKLPPTEYHMLFRRKLFIVLLELNLIVTYFHQDTQFDNLEEVRRS